MRRSLTIPAVRRGGEPLQGPSHLPSCSEPWRRFPTAPSGSAFLAPGSDPLRSSSRLVLLLGEPNGTTRTGLYHRGVPAIGTAAAASSDVPKSAARSAVGENLRR